MANKGLIAKTYASAYLYSKGNYEKNLVNFIMTADEIDKDSEAFKDIKFDVKRRQIDSSLIKVLESRNIKPVSYTHLTLPTNSRV